MEIGLVRKIDIDHEMQQAYLDYAMSVIVSRALPDARDGLKPVHRRILYAMYDMGLRPDSAYKKSARIVGEVLGKYHPHGDAAVYESMARLAQDFSMRYLLVDGQGNFGSVDGDPPAAMRYTEARLATPATHMLADIQKNTVDFSSNFDDTLTEPTVLPSALPNLLVNGATGIAVGMATSIPPHNLGEVVDAIHLMLEHWENLDELNVEDLMQHVQGPDFPTGGVLVHSAGEDGLVSAYSTGRGQVTIQARAHLEEMERGRSRIIVTELPYMTNKATLIERIAELAREEKIEGISDLRDESDRHGMRIVIELNKNADPEAVLRGLYKHTPMQTNFSIIMLALVEGEPRTLSLKQALRVYVEHRLEIVRRRSQHDLEKAQARAHILDGLRIALKNLDEIIDLIRKAPDVDTARTRLIKRFKLSELQAQAILDMQLRRLAALERKKIEEEYKELQVLIKDLTALLRSPKKMRQVVGDELSRVKETYGDQRRTHIVQLKEGQSRATLVSASEMAPEKEVWVSVTAGGLIARSLEDRLPALDSPQPPAWLMKASLRDTLYLVGESGEAAALPVHTLPEKADPQQGAPYERISALKDGRTLAAVLCIPARGPRVEDETETAYVVTVTRQGMVKKSARNDLPGPSANLFTLVKVNPGDRLAWVGLSQVQSELLLATAEGMAIRFGADEVRPMGLAAAGVMGVKLAAGDEVVGAALLPAPGDVLLAANNAKAKRVPQDHFPRQGRYGNGVQAWKPVKGERVVGLALGERSLPAVLHFTQHEPLAIHFEDAPMQARATSGKPLLALEAGDALERLTIPSLPGHVSPGLNTAAAPVTSPGGRDENPPAVRPAAPKARPTNGKTGAPAGSAAKKAAASKAKPAAPGKPVGPAKTGPAAKKPAASKAQPAGKEPAPGKTRPAAKKAAAPAAKPAAKASPPEKAPSTAKKPAASTAKPAASEPAKPAPAAKKPAANKPAASPTQPPAEEAQLPLPIPAAKKKKSGPAGGD